MELDGDPTTMSYRELQATCKEVGLPAQGKTEELRKRLLDYAKDPIEALKRAIKEQQKKKVNKGWIDWRNCAAREILLEDVEQNGWLYGKDEDAKVVYEFRQPFMDILHNF